MAKQDLVKELEQSQGALNQALSNIAIKDDRIGELEEDLKLAEARARSAYADRDALQSAFETLRAELQRKDALIARLTERYIMLEDSQRR